MFHFTTTFSGRNWTERYVQVNNTDHLGTHACSLSITCNTPLDAHSMATIVRDTVRKLTTPFVAVKLLWGDVIYRRRRTHKSVAFKCLRLNSPQPLLSARSPYSLTYDTIQQLGNNFHLSSRQHLTRAQPLSRQRAIDSAASPPIIMKCADNSYRASGWAEEQPTTIEGRLNGTITIPLCRVHFWQETWCR